jgi:hypothetical protein
VVVEEELILQVIQEMKQMVFLVDQVVVLQIVTLLVLLLVVQEIMWQGQ